MVVKPLMCRVAAGTAAVRRDSLCHQLHSERHIDALHCTGFHAVDSRLINRSFLVGSLLGTQLCRVSVCTVALRWRNDCVILCRLRYRHQSSCPYVCLSASVSSLASALAGDKSTVDKRVLTGCCVRVPLDQPIPVLTIDWSGMQYQTPCPTLYLQTKHCLCRAARYWLNTST